MTLIYSLKKLTFKVKTTFTTLQLFLLSLCLILIEKANAHILVYRRVTNQLIEEYNDMPAQFGPSLPAHGLKVFVIPANPIRGCSPILPFNHSGYPPNAKFAAIIERGGENCSFELKVRNAQNNFDAVVVYNNAGDDLETMSAANSTGIRIPSVFVGRSTGLSLLSFHTEDVIVTINDELPFNINTQLILPFSILIGLCFLIMIFYMIYKCIRDERRLRRYRLPKSMLKKLPVLKYSKRSGIAQETCVICIEDFFEGEKLRMLPCKHVYHTHCIDPWLTENRRVCPICKRKVFTKGEARANQNRQSSLDSVTDTDDDTTPLLQQTSNNNSFSGRGRNTVQIHPALTTPRGTWNTGSIPSDIPTSDEENVLLTQQPPIHNVRRVNPFDRRPNLPPHLADQLNETNRRSIWFHSILRIFRRQPQISVAAPPFPEDLLQNNRRVSNTSGQPVAQQPSSATPATTPTVAHSGLSSSNNILNPNLSGSFKDDDDIPHQSLYEPIEVASSTGETSNDPVEHEVDSVFIQTGVQGGIGVAAIPNTSSENYQSDAVLSHSGRFWV